MFKVPALSKSSNNKKDNTRKWNLSSAYPNSCVGS